MSEEERALVKRTRDLLKSYPTSPFSPLWIEKLLGIIDNLDAEASRLFKTLDEQDEVR